VLCCIGDLVEDVVVRLSSDIATGSDTQASIVRRRGGSAANVAVAAVSCGLDVRFIGRVGSDSIGAALVEELRSKGVDPRVQSKGRTGTIVVLVGPDGERSMLPDRAAATGLTEIGAVDLEDVAWLHVPAYSLVVEPLGSATKQAIDTVRRSGAAISIDASSVAIITEMGVDKFKGMLEELRPDVVLCNADEGAALGVSESKGLRGVAVAIVKAGRAPAIGYAHGKLMASVPALPLNDVRDTTGAGDAFAAGFISARMSSLGLEQAISAGHDATALVLTEHSS
jgi:sugar/nucleoside kinase (ribokinase family)